MKILANDGLDQSGIDALTEKGFEVITAKVPQDFLIDFINENKIKTILVRSATLVRKELIDACPTLEIIGRGGVGMDNIDVDYARSKNIHVINTPSASSESVAELVFAHLFSGARFLQDSNRKMPVVGDSEFALMKNGVAIVNCSRGGVIDENALINALNSGKVAFAGLDVFINEPTPSKEILNHPRISLTPHTGASTLEAQDRIGLSLAEQICSILQVH